MISAARRAPSAANDMSSTGGGSWSHRARITDVWAEKAAVSFVYELIIFVAAVRSQERVASFGEWWSELRECRAPMTLD
jgi:hypothetical protein